MKYIFLKNGERKELFDAIKNENAEQWGKYFLSVFFTEDKTILETLLHEIIKKMGTNKEFTISCIKSLAEAGVDLNALVWFF